MLPGTALFVFELSKSAYVTVPLSKLPDPNHDNYVSYTPNAFLVLATNDRLTGTLLPSSRVSS